jgi:hypothetical protein
MIYRPGFVRDLGQVSGEFRTLGSQLTMCFRR